MIINFNNQSDKSIFIFLFDNTFSWYRHKCIRYKITISEWQSLSTTSIPTTVRENFSRNEKSVEKSVTTDNSVNEKSVMNKLFPTVSETHIDLLEQKQEHLPSSDLKNTSIDKIESNKENKPRSGTSVHHSSANINEDVDKGNENEHNLNHTKLIHWIDSVLELYKKPYRNQFVITTSSTNNTNEFNNN